MTVPASAPRTLAALRQLATLGLPGRSVVPEAMGLLKRLAGFDLWALRIVDAQLRLVEGFAAPEIDPRQLKDFAENFHNREAGGAAGVAAASILGSGQKVILSSRFVDWRKLQGTDFWERIIRPTGMGMPAQIPFLDGPRPFAIAVLSRSLTAPDFSPAAVRLLEEAQPWMCHLLRRTEAEAAAGEAVLPTSDAGVLTLDPGGRIDSASPGALDLLLHALDQGLHAASLRLALQGDVGSLLKRLAESVGAGLHGAPTTLPAVSLRNRYGRFSLRAYGLGAFTPGAPVRTTLHIERQAPVSQRLFSAPRFLALPNREREMALHLVRGRSHTEAAREMGIKPSSAVDAIRFLYRRLDIDSRDKLVPALLDAQV